MSQTALTRLDKEGLPQPERLGNTSLIDLETEIDTLYDKYVGTPATEGPKPNDTHNKQVTFSVPSPAQTLNDFNAHNISPSFQNKSDHGISGGALEDDNQDILAPDEN